MAGMSIRSAQKWQCGPLPSETGQERWWRTRTDPFGGVWEEEILPLLQGEAAGRLRATTIIEWLEDKFPGRFSASQLRTLQRRLRDWRALNGPDQEVYFPIDRLSKGLTYGLQVTEGLHLAGVELRSLSDDFDTATSTGKLQLARRGVAIPGERTHFSETKRAYFRSGDYQGPKTVKLETGVEECFA